MTPSDAKAVLGLVVIAALLFLASVSMRVVEWWLGRRDDKEPS